ncbi:MAG: CARDB domain-containing protein, partial [Thermoplasmata archaeon]
GSQVSSVYDGETVTLETRVSNVGGASTSTIPVTFYVDRGEPTQEAIGTIYVSGLTPGSTSSYYSTTWESEMVTPGMTEDRDITVVVNDPYTVTSEQVMGNNYGNISLEIKNPADLSIDSNDIEFSTDKSQVNDPVEITALVYNNGGEDVNTKVTFFKGEISAANIIGEDTISITAGNSTQANITWTPESRGNHEITVYVDYYEDIYETYLTNNFATVQKAIFSTDYRFDLIVNDANTPQSIGTYKSSGYVLVEESGVLNIDGSQSRAQFEMIQDKDNKYSIIVKDQGTLNIDYSMLYSGYYFNVLVMDEGELVIRNRSMVYDMITIQSTDNSTVTIDETSVEGPVEIMGENFYSSGSQYTSDDLYINPSYIECMNASFAANLDDFHDTTGSLTATSTNSISMTGNSEIEIYRWMRITTVSNGSIPISGARVGASSTSTDYSIWRSTNSQGTTYLRLLTDVLTSTESTFVGNYELKAYYLEETDNYTADTISYASPNYPSTTYEQSMTIRFESLWIPDLSITDSDVSTDLSEVTMGDPITITANIMNEGQVDAEDIDVHFYLVQEGEDLLLGTVTQSMIPSLGNETVEFEWISTMDDDTIKEENKTVMVMVDPEIQPLKDANAGNNDAKTNFKVRSPPKLEFLSDNIRVWMSGKTVVNNTVMEMDEVSISIDLMNTGGTYVNNASITLVIDGEVVNRKTVDLPLDKEINFTSKWTAVYDWVETDEAVTLPLSIWLNSSAEDPEYSESISSQIEVEQMTPSFTGVNIPTGKQKSGEFIYVTGYLLRDGDNKPIQGMRVTAYIVDENGDPVTADQETATTNADGEFQLQLVTPEEAGTYSVTLEADHASDATYTTSQSFDVESTTTGLPWWLILVAVLGAVGAVGGVIFYLKWKGAGEWVECGECGATIQADSKVCPKCGTEFEMETVKCSECGEWISMDSRECPHCGAEFITTGKEIQQYGEAMEKQYEKYVDKFRNKAKSKWGENFTEDKFIDWWRRQPSYMTYDQWLEKEEAKRREGGIECPECGTLNSAGAAICQKCGTSLIKVERPVQRTLRTPEEEKEDEEKKEREKEEKLEEKKEVVKKPQRVVKKVKKKPKKVSKGESEESSEESETSTKKPKKVVKKVKKKPKKEE